MKFIFNIQIELNFNFIVLELFYRLEYEIEG
jgi:hypothetical protein